MRRKRIQGGRVISGLDQDLERPAAGTIDCLAIFHHDGNQRSSDGIGHGREYKTSLLVLPYMEHDRIRDEFRILGYGAYEQRLGLVARAYSDIRKHDCLRA